MNGGEIDFDKREKLALGYMSTVVLHKIILEKEKNLFFMLVMISSIYGVSFFVKKEQK